MQRTGPLLLVVLPLALIVAFVLALLLLLQPPPSSACGGGGVGSVSGKDIPPKLIPLYQGAGARYHLGPLGPAVLAAINSIESDFGRNPSTSSAGAQGWMQFIPSTWATYGVAIGHTGAPDLQRPADAIYGAANYLHASGAPNDWHRAVFQYNHAEWYVSQVLNKAQQYAKAGNVSAATPTSTTPTVPNTSSSGAPGSTQGITDAPGSDCGNAAAPGSYISLPGGSQTPAQLKQLNGVTNVRWSGGPLATWVAYLYVYARQHGWDGAPGQVDRSGFRTHADQLSVCCGPGGFGNKTSHHEGTRWPSGAMDIGNPTSQARFNMIIGASPYRGMIYQSAPSQDSVHESSGLYANGTSF